MIDNTSKRSLNLQTECVTLRGPHMKRWKRKANFQWLLLGVVMAGLGFLMAIYVVGV